MISKPFFSGLLMALLLIGGAAGARACQYCRMAATNPEAARMAAQIHSGGFPLDSTINQFQGIVPSATLTAPPTPGEVVTSAADLPVPVARLQALAKEFTQTTKSSAAIDTTVKMPPTAPSRWSDAGLLGLAAVGGLFCWRTRRVAGHHS